MSDHAGGFSGDPAPGVPIRDAIVFFAPLPDSTDANGKNILQRFIGLRLRAAIRYQGAPPFTESDRREMLGLQWMYLGSLVRRLRANMLYARGFAPGSLTLIDIPPEWWDGLMHSDQPTIARDVDVANSSATAHGTTVLGILVFERESTERAPIQTEVAVPPKSRRGAVINYTETDKPLLAQMEMLILSNQATGPTDAARAVEKSAKGKHSDAKVTRLAAAYKKSGRPTQSGQSGQSGAPD